MFILLLVRAVCTIFGVRRYNVQRRMCDSYYRENSSERDVSLVSCECVHQAFVELGIQMKLLSICDLNEVILKLNARDVDVICLCRSNAENGAVQRLLEKHGIPYTGSGPNAPALGMDKLACNRIPRSVGVRVPRALTC